MDAADPIDAYLDELERQLRVPRRARRRILTEVRAHLLDAAEAEQPATEGSCAAERAVLRFGPAAETARQFNIRAGRRNALLRRALVPSMAAVAVTSMVTATVWAFGPGPAPSRPRQAPAHLPQRQRCAAERERLDAPCLHSGRARAHGR
jgi:hypothetical protein